MRKYRVGVLEVGQRGRVIALQELLVHHKWKVKVQQHIVVDGEAKEKSNDSKKA